MPDVVSYLIGAAGTLGGWAYPIVGGLAFLETAALIGLVAPGELAVVTGGVLAGSGQLDLLTLIAVVWASALAGDCSGFLVGRRFGRGGLMERIENARPTAVRRVRTTIEQHGAKTVILGRFVGVLRAFAPLTAGAMGMSPRRFVAADALGSGLWSITFCVLGYTFWHSLDSLVDVLQRTQLVVGAVVLVAVATAVALRIRRRPR